VNPLDWSLVDGWLPIAFTLVGFAAVVAILARRDRVWWIRVVPITVTAGTVATAALVYPGGRGVAALADPMPPIVMVWVGIALITLALAVIRFAALGWRGRTAAALAGLLIVVVAAEQANAYFSAYPTLRAALGNSVPTTPFERVAAPVPDLVSPPPGGRIVEVWHAPAACRPRARCPRCGSRPPAASAPGRPGSTAARLSRPAPRQAARAGVGGRSARRDPGLDRRRAAPGDDGPVRCAARRTCPGRGAPG